MASSIPFPPSFVPVPPKPMYISLAPRRIASTINSPVPMLLARRGSSSTGLISVSPLAAALSMMAIRPARPYEASIVRPSGSWTRALTDLPPSASVRTEARPSPPSETGSTTVSCPARPSAIAAAASAELRHPLKESIAMTAFIWNGGLCGLACRTASCSMDQGCRQHRDRSIPDRGFRDTARALRTLRRLSWAG